MDEIEEIYNKLKLNYKYDLDTGDFIFLRHKILKGKIAGARHSKGYITITINNKQYYAHRVAWLYVYGKWPEQIDHINCNKHDNRWINLRLATKSENARNRGKNKNNTTGYKGIHKNRQGYMVRIIIGTYKTLEEAVKVYERVVKLHHGEFARAK